MAKILFIQPPFADYYSTRVRNYPLGLLYLASAVRERVENTEIKVYDFPARGPARQINPPPEYAFMGKYYTKPNKSPFRLFGHYSHYGASWEDIEAVLAEEQPDIACVSYMFSTYYGYSKKTSSLIKSASPKTILIAGGCHVSAEPEAVLYDGKSDYIITGEGETALSLLLDKLVNGRGASPSLIPSVGKRSSGGVTLNSAKGLPDLDGLPFPARDLLDKDAYTSGNKRHTMILASRGCPYSCSFCAGYKRNYRVRSLENILEEIKACVGDLNIKSFDFEDDNITFDRERSKALLSSLAAEFKPGELDFYAMNGLRASDLYPGAAKLFKAAGFRHLDLPVVSGSRKTLAFFNREEKRTLYSEAARQCSKAGLPATAYIIIGAPGQTAKSALSDLYFAFRLGMPVSVSIFYATRDMPAYPRLLADRIITEAAPAFSRTSVPWIETREMKRKDIITFFRLARICNYITGLTNGPEGKKDSPARLRDRLNRLFGNARPDKEGKVRLDKGMAGLFCLHLFLRYGVIYGFFKTKDDLDKDLYVFFREYYSITIVRDFRKAVLRKQRARALFKKAP